MIIETDDKELADFILYGRSEDKRFKTLQRSKTFIRDLNKVIFILRNAVNVSELHQHGKLNYEVLKGDRRGQSSVRIGYKSPYRLIFTEHDEGIRIILIEISKHYGDK